MANPLLRLHSSSPSSFFLFLLLLLFYRSLAKLEGATISRCQQKWFSDAQSFVCVCSGQFCDEPESIGPLEDRQIVFYTSDKEKERLERRRGKFEKTRAEGAEKEAAANILPIVHVDSSVHFQTILGFGGAFSDAAGLNLNKLSSAARQNLLRAYFDPDRGIGYALGRVPIASTDFSTREYSYLDQERDFELDTFQLAPEDQEAKIPHIKMAMKMSDNQLRLFAAPWASPAWMKSNGRMSGEGQLKGDLDGPYYLAYARYLKRFFDEYSAHGVNFWALTLQNQPESGLEKDFPFQAMFLSNHSQRQFAARLLVPLLKQSAHTANLRLIAFDDVREHLLSSAREIFAANDHQSSSSSTPTRFGLCNSIRHFIPSFLPKFALEIAENVGGGGGGVFLLLLLKSSPSPLPPNSILKLFGWCREEIDRPEGADLIDGIGVHWYQLEGHQSQSEFHQMYPDKFILPTEACAGFLPDDQGPRLGNWTRGWMYGHDIVENMRNWAIGWVEWNLCLDMEGGPNWVKNYVDAPILVDGQKDEFYKQPMFYFLAHFSRFVPPGSVRIDSSLTGLDGSSQVENVAFLTPSGQKVLVLISPPDATESTINLAIRDKQRPRMEAKLTLKGGAILTGIWA